MQTIASTLSQDERQTFAACEKIISAGLKTFSEVGNALLYIRNNRLYREGFASFEKYCREKWAMSDRRAHQLCDAAEVVNNIQGLNNCSVIPKTESQARPLATLPPKQQSEAWQKAQEKAASEGQQVTARHVEAAVGEIKPKTLDDKFKEAFGGKVPDVPADTQLVQLPKVTLKEAESLIEDAVEMVLIGRTATELHDFHKFLNHLAARVRVAKPIQTETLQAA